LFFIAKILFAECIFRILRGIISFVMCVKLENQLKPTNS